eukprot:SAG31_NODE_13929_length_837_cov_0.979675_2_plen_32_part_01
MFIHFDVNGRVQQSFIHVPAVAPDDDVKWPSK